MKETVNDLIVQLNAEGWHLPTIDDFPEGSTPRTLYELTITQCTDPDYAYNVDAPWAPLHDMTPQSVFIWIHGQTRALLPRLRPEPVSLFRRLLRRARSLVRIITL
jgi:hypothetical protein